MKLKLFLNIFLLLVILPAIQAQKTPEIEISDPKAVNLLNKVSDKLSKAENYGADFIITIEYPEEDPLVRKGSMIQEGTKYFVDLQDQTFTCDGSSVWVHQLAQQEIQITDAEEGNEGFNNPSDFLSIYEKEEFIFGIMNSYNQGKHKIKEIEFKPLETDSEFFKVRIVLNESLLEIREVITFYKNGSQFKLHVDKWKLNVPSTPGLFQFDASKFPGVHVEDLRF